MSGKIVIDTERCKSCGLCIAVCPQKNIHISEQSNKKGYFPAEVLDHKCTACRMCAIVCPDAIITVFKDEIDKIKIIETPGKKKQLQKQEAEKLK